MAIAFDDEGVTYAGSSLGDIFKFSEQAQEMVVSARKLPNQLCRVTALWFNPYKKQLISSGDDGMLHLWDTKSWKAGGNNVPVDSYDLNKYVIAELKGTIVKMDDKELDKPNQLVGALRPHSIYGDEEGNVLVGTVANEIYEFKFPSHGGGGDPMCYMQGHYDEMWGLAMHPNQIECATGAEDETLRIWNLNDRTFKLMQKLPQVPCAAAYSPDGQWIAVGMGGKNAKHKHSGKWVVLDSNDLSIKFEPPHALRTRRRV